MARFTVRPVVARDVAFIEALIDHARSAHEPWAASWRPRALKDELATAEVYVATQTEDDLFAGFVCVRPPGHAWEITLIAVDRAFRGHGVAKALLTFVEKVIERDERGAATRHLSLEVRADNMAAIRTYESYGFQVVGHRRGYYPDGADAILYTKA